MCSNNFLSADHSRHGLDVKIFDLHHWQLDIFELQLAAILDTLIIYPICKCYTQFISYKICNFYVCAL